jgi:hypothetical protein
MNGKKLGCKFKISWNLTGSDRACGEGKLIILLEFISREELIELGDIPVLDRTSCNIELKEEKLELMAPTADCKLVGAITTGVKFSAISLNTD